MARRQRNRDFSGGPIYDEKIDRWVVGVMYPDGSRVRRRFRREKLASRYWAGELLRIENGTWKEQKTPRLSFGEALAKYREFSKQHHRSYTTFVEPCLALWERELGSATPLARITSAMIEEVKLARAREVSQATVDRYLQALKALFNWLIEHEYASVNPVRKVRMFRPNNEVVRYLTRAQYDALLKAAENGPDYLRDLVVLAVHTGLRRGNLLRLRWSEIDLHKGIVRIASMTKSKKTIEIPLNETAKAVLKGRKDNASQWVFPGQEESHLTDVKNPFATALRLAISNLKRAKMKDDAEGLEGFRFHDLRHTAASWLAMGGASLGAIQRFLGHASIKMTLRYAHLSPGFLEKEVRILDNVVKG